MNSGDALTLNAWIERGGFAEAVVRMALVGGGGPIEADSAVWNDDPRLSAVPEGERDSLVAEQASIARFSRSEAIDTLGVLLPAETDRGRALALALRVAGYGDGFDPGVQARIRRVLGLPRFRSQRPRSTRGMPTTYAQSWCAAFPPAVVGH